MQRCTLLKYHNIMIKEVSLFLLIVLRCEKVKKLTMIALHGLRDLSKSFTNKNIQAFGLCLHQIQIRAPSVVGKF